MADPIPESLAFLIAFWVNALLCGVYFVLFLQWLSHPSSRGKRARLFQFVCWFCFVASNINTGINFWLLLEGFWFSLPGGPDVFFAKVGNWQTMFREAVFITTVLVCDSFMVFRLWRLWDKSWLVIIVPMLLLLSETAIGYLAAVQVGSTNYKLLELSINLILGLNTAVQVLITILIGYCLIWRNSIRHLPAAQRTLRVQIVRCMIESGLLVTMVLLVNIGVVSRNSNFHWVLHISLTHIYPITTILIVLRVRNTLEPSESSIGHSSQLGTGTQITRPTMNIYPSPPRYEHERDSLELAPSSWVDMKGAIGVEVTQETYHTAV